MFSNTSYFKLYININIINNIIYSELLRTIVLELLGSFENQDPKTSGTFENQDPKSSGTFGLLLSTKLPRSSRTIVLKSSK